MTTDAAIPEQRRRSPLARLLRASVPVRLDRWRGTGGSAVVGAGAADGRGSSPRTSSTSSGAGSGSAARRGLAGPARARRPARRPAPATGLEPTLVAGLGRGFGARTAAPARSAPVASGVRRRGLGVGPRRGSGSCFFLRSAAEAERRELERRCSSGVLVCHGGESAIGPGRVNPPASPESCGSRECRAGRTRDGFGPARDLREIGLVGLTGFEPAASSSRTRRATKLRHSPNAGEPDRSTREHGEHTRASTAPRNRAEERRSGARDQRQQGRLGTAGDPDPGVRAGADAGRDVQPGRPRVTRSRSRRDAGAGPWPAPARGRSWCVSAPTYGQAHLAAVGVAGDDRVVAVARRTGPAPAGTARARPPSRTSASGSAGPATASRPVVARGAGRRRRRTRSVVSPTVSASRRLVRSSQPRLPEAGPQLAPGQRRGVRVPLARCRAAGSASGLRSVGEK